MKAKLVTPTPFNEIIASHHHSTIRLSDNAFYLIVLASLLKGAVEPGSLQRALTPGNTNRIENDNLNRIV